MLVVYRVETQESNSIFSLGVMSGEWSLEVTYSLIILESASNIVIYKRVDYMLTALRLVSVYENTFDYEY